MAKKVKWDKENELEMVRRIISCANGFDRLIPEARCFVLEKLAVVAWKGGRR
jgi:hypothetical protein